MTTNKTNAFWEVYLHCDCPNCQENVDLLEYPDFGMAGVLKPVRIIPTEHEE